MIVDDNLIFKQMSKTEIAFRKSNLKQLPNVLYDEVRTSEANRSDYFEDKLSSVVTPMRFCMEKIKLINFVIPKSLYHVAS